MPWPDCVSLILQPSRSAKRGLALRRRLRNAPPAFHACAGAFPTGKRLQQLPIGFANIFARENEGHVVNVVVVCEEFSCRFYSDLRSFLDRVAVSAATDRRKRYRLDSVFQ